VVTQSSSPHRPSRNIDADDRGRHSGTFSVVASNEHNRRNARHLQALKPAVPILTKDFDNRAGFGDDMTIVFDHRWFAERVNPLELGRCQATLWISLVLPYLVWKTEFLLKPKDTLRT
jgi:hypothetical protein